MNFDLRLPLGLLFGFYGVVLTAYGLISNGDTKLYAKSLGININLIWGLVLAAFGIFMLLLAWRARPKS